MRAKLHSIVRQIQWPWRKAPAEHETPLDKEFHRAYRQKYRELFLKEAPPTRTWAEFKAKGHRDAVQAELERRKRLYRAS